MRRCPVQIRVGALADAASLVDIWELGRPHGSRGDAEVEAGIRKALASDHERILVATADDRVVGAVHLRVAPLGPLSSELGVHVSHLHVHEDFRRRGIARGLMESAVSWAEENAVARVVTMAAVNSRESSRFMARLGFTQALVLRVAPTAALRARLPVDPVRPAAGGRQLAQVLAARRSARRKQNVFG